MEASPDFHAIKQRLVNGTSDDWSTWPSDTLASLPSLHDSSGRSLVHHAQTPSALSFLLSHGCSPTLVDTYGQSPLHLAVASDLLPIASALLSIAPSLLRLRDAAGKESLLSSTSAGMLQLLHAAGADLDTADAHGLTLMHSAARIGREPQVRYLLSHAAIASPTDVSGRSSTHYACENGHMDVLRLLLAVAPQSAGQADAAGWTPLHFAALGAWPMHESHSDVVALLTARGVDPAPRDAQGLTPLHVCTDTPAARVLVAAGAPLEAADGLGRVPLHYASHENSIMLLEEGAAVDPRDRLGRSPLHTCTEGDKVDYLVLRGADVNAVDVDGQTPLDWALEAERLDVAEALQRRGGVRGRTSERERANGSATASAPSATASRCLVQ